MAKVTERIPSSEDLDTTITYALNHPRKMLVLTMILKVHIRSQRKYEALLWAIKTVTTMTARILDHLREDPHQFKDRGAIMCVVQLFAFQQQKETTSHPVRNLAEIIRKQHGYHPDVQVLGSQISAILRDGVFKSCASMILRWYDRSIESLFERDDELEDESVVQLSHSSMLNPEEIHRVWAINHQAYKDAAAVIIPFGRHRGKKLGDVGERELQWLCTRLLPSKELEPLLKAVEARLYPDPDNTAGQRKAGHVAHPWKEKPQAQRAVRADHLSQQTLATSKQRVLLAEISDQELEKLHDELLDMRVFARQYAKIDAAVNRLLETEFHNFPFVAPFYDEQQQREYERKHTQTLNRFRTPFPVNAKSVDRYTPADLERLEETARNDILRAEQLLVEPKTHVLHFTRSIFPTPEGIKRQGYAILYDPETFRYEMIVNLYGRHAPKAIADTPETNGDQNRYFVNYPDHPYIDRKRLPHLSFGLECGYDYQDQQFLRAAIGYGDGEDSPRPKLADAKIVSEVNAEGRHDFFVHIPVKIPLRPLGLQPTAILAFHHHYQGYSYALTDRDGTSIDVGDLVIPTHVLRSNVYRPFSKNYVYEVVHAMLNLAYSSIVKGIIPFIVIEDTRWKKETSLSRTRNQQIFSHPTGEILDALTDKALLQGYMKPLHVWGVSPGRQCGSCNHMHPEGQDATRKAALKACPTCQSSDLEANEPQRLTHCRSCQHDWQAEERLFMCDGCGIVVLARYNTARATARQARYNAVVKYDRLQERKTKSSAKKTLSPSPTIHDTLEEPSV